MAFFIEAFNIILYRPILNALILIYHYLPGQNFGLAIIALTFLIKLLLSPITQKAIVSQKALADLQPKIKEVQKKYKKEKDKQARAMMELYRKEKVNPLSGCLPLLIQMPILIALFQVFSRGFEPDQVVHLYEFVPRLYEQFQPLFLGINLRYPNLVFAVIAGLFQFLQTKMLTPKTKIKAKKPGKVGFGQAIQKQMLYFFPFFTFIILIRLPSAVALYWITVSLFSMGQQYIFLQRKKRAKQKKEDYDKR